MLPEGVNCPSLAVYNNTFSSGPGEWKERQTKALDYARNGVKGYEV